MWGTVRSKVRLVILAVAASLVAGAPGLAAPGLASAAELADVPLGAEVVGWTGLCPYTYSARVDPIVNPGMPSMHLHDFFGTSPTKDYDFNDFRSNGTVCRLVEDTSGYWIPALYIPGGGGSPKKVDPTASLTYWMAPPKSEKATLLPIPRNLKMIAGDSMAEEPQDLDMVWFDCSGDAFTPRAPAPYLCASGTVVQAHIRFPSCWDGTPPAEVGNDSGHMAYPAHEKCAAGWFRVPGIHLIISYPIQDGRGATLASGMGSKDPTSIYSLHADYFHAWDQVVHAQLVSGCLNTKIEVSCGLATSPTVDRFDPPTARVGDTVTIGGSSFRGALQVTFNGIPATYTVYSSAMIVAQVPVGAKTGPVSVTTDGGTGVNVRTTGASAEDFEVR